MRLNRKLQSGLLNYIASSYPGQVTQSELAHEFKVSEEEVYKECIYLKEHGVLILTRASLDDSIEHRKTFIFYRITAKGLDFLEEDGGLSAILNTVNVRLHADTIRDMIEAKIMESDRPEDEKSQLKSSLHNMKEEGLKVLINRLVNEGLSNAPNAWRVLTQFLS